MGAVFELLHQNGTKKPEILELMANLKFTPNMQRLLEEAVDNLEATIIIISDSNSEFIHHILKEYKLSERVDKVFTNPQGGRRRKNLKSVRTITRKHANYQL